MKAIQTSSVLGSPFATFALALAILTGNLTATADTLSPDDPRLLPARITSVDQSGFKHVFIDGYIHKPTVEAFSRATSADSARFGIVYFNSAGGDLSAAEELGRRIRDKGFATQIGKLAEDQIHIGIGVCESACPIAFVGGKFRLLDTGTGQLGVHRFYLAKPGRWAADSKVLFTAERDLLKYLREMGISDEFFELVMRTPADRIQPVGKRASYEWKLGTGSEYATWNLTEDGKLLGLGETSTGGLALTLACADDTLQFTAKFKPWFPAAALLNYDTHSITVNGAKYPVAAVNASFDKASEFIIFNATLDDGTVQALRSAERVGYSLSYEHAPGEYSRSLGLDEQQETVKRFWSTCSTNDNG